MLSRRWRVLQARDREEEQVAGDAPDACVLDETICALHYGAPLDLGRQAALWATGEFHAVHDPVGGLPGLAAIGRGNRRGSPTPVCAVIRASHHQEPGLQPSVPSLVGRAG